MGPVEPSVEERFWRNVAKSEGCWIWTGYANAKGYGSIFVDGKARVATHVAVRLATGQWPAPGMIVCHHCDNPPCVNPAPLFVGTHGDNMRDCVSKGRNYVPDIPAAAKSRGERHGSSKLSASEVMEIFTSSATQRALAAQYGVGQKSIWCIRSGKTWRHVTRAALLPLGGGSGDAA